MILKLIANLSVKIYTRDIGQINQNNVTSYMDDSLHMRCASYEAQMTLHHIVNYKAVFAVIFGNTQISHIIPGNLSNRLTGRKLEFRTLCWQNFPVFPITLCMSVIGAIFRYRSIFWIEHKAFLHCVWSFQIHLPSKYEWRHNLVSQNNIAIERSDHRRALSNNHFRVAFRKQNAGLEHWDCPPDNYPCCWLVNNWHSCHYQNHQKLSLVLEKDMLQLVHFNHAISDIHQYSGHTSQREVFESRKKYRNENDHQHPSNNGREPESHSEW